MNANSTRLKFVTKIRISFLLILVQQTIKNNYNMRDNILSTLFVDIDVNYKTNILCVLNFEVNKRLNLKASHNTPSTESISKSTLD